MQHIRFAAVMALPAVILVGCANEVIAHHEVSGKVESVGFGGSGNAPERYFKLEGNPDVFTCLVNDVRNCGPLKEGLTVTMQVNGNLTIDSLEYVEPK